MLALVGANYKFIVLDVGSYGKEGDSSIFNKSALGKKILLHSQCFFPSVLPHIIVGDEAFRLHKNIIKPLNKATAASDRSKALFNYILSRARRVNENAFGLLSQVFRVFYTHISIKLEVCHDMIMAACCLHNLLREGYLEKNDFLIMSMTLTKKKQTFFIFLKEREGIKMLKGLASVINF